MYTVRLCAREVMYKDRFVLRISEVNGADLDNDNHSTRTSHGVSDTGD